MVIFDLSTVRTAMSRRKQAKPNRLEDDLGRHEVTNEDGGDLGGHGGRPQQALEDSFEEDEMGSTGSLDDGKFCHFCYFLKILVHFD